MAKKSIALKNETAMQKEFEEWVLAFLAEKDLPEEEMALYRQCYFMAYVGGMEEVIDAVNLKLDTRDESET